MDRLNSNSFDRNLGWGVGSSDRFSNISKPTWGPYKDMAPKPMDDFGPIKINSDHLFAQQKQVAIKPANNSFFKTDLQKAADQCEFGVKSVETKKTHKVDATWKGGGVTRENHVKVECNPNPKLKIK
ncbi:MAG: hypothetical protein VW397_08705 [Candidatus Margulisiibacteriota bacterium]